MFPGYPQSVKVGGGAFGSGSSVIRLATSRNLLPAGDSVSSTCTELVNAACAGGDGHELVIWNDGVYNAVCKTLKINRHYRSLLSLSYLTEPVSV